MQKAKEGQSMVRGIRESDGFISDETLQHHNTDNTRTKETELQLHWYNVHFIATLPPTFLSVEA